MFIEKNVPDIFRWVNYLFTSNNQTSKSEYKMPIAFKNTKKVCRIFEMMYFGLIGTRTYMSELLVHNKQYQTLNNTNIGNIYTYSNSANVNS